MWEESECVHCGAVLIDLRGEPKEPCPICGKTGRRFNMDVESEMMAFDHLRMQGKPRGAKKFSFDVRAGASYFRKDNVWHHLERLIDRTNDRYVETVKVFSTGELISHVDEKLSDHVGHGSDKPRGRVDEP